jgi:hypothetical protein
MLSAPLNLRTKRQYKRHLFKRRAAGVSRPVLANLRTGKLTLAARLI